MPEASDAAAFLLTVIFGTVAMLSSILSGYRVARYIGVDLDVGAIAGTALGVTALVSWLT